MMMSSVSQYSPLRQDPALVPILIVPHPRRRDRRWTRAGHWWDKRDVRRWAAIRRLDMVRDRRSRVQRVEEEGCWRSDEGILCVYVAYGH